MEEQENTEQPTEANTSETQKEEKPETTDKPAEDKKLSNESEKGLDKSKTSQKETPKPEVKEEKLVEKKPEKPKKERKPFKIREFYDKNYKKLLIIPFALLFLAILSITFQTITTGDFINRDVTLKGGLTVTIPLDQQVDTLELQEHLSGQFPANDLSIRNLKGAGSNIGIIIDSDIDGTQKSEIDSLLDELRAKLNMELEEGSYTVEFIGSSLGASFFKETFRALLIAFLFMGIVVFFYFRVPVPSIAVILAALSDIIITLAIVNLMGMKISTAGIAAFLMLIGYSVDTDILLSTRLLKRKEGTEMDRIIGAFKTGITMTITTTIAVTVALIFTKSDVIAQIMTILLIGLIVDVINTWIQNVGILRLYLEKKRKKSVAKNGEA